MHGAQDHIERLGDLLICPCGSPLGTFFGLKGDRGMRELFRCGFATSDYLTELVSLFVGGVHLVSFPGHREPAACSS